MPLKRLKISHKVRLYLTLYLDIKRKLLEQKFEFKRKPRKFK